MNSLFGNLQNLLVFGKNIYFHKLNGARYELANIIIALDIFEIALSVGDPLSFHAAV